MSGKKVAGCTRHRAVKLYNARRKPDKIFSAGARLRTRLAVNDTKIRPPGSAGEGLHHRPAARPRELSGHTPVREPRHTNSTQKLSEVKMKRTLKITRTLIAFGLTAAILLAVGCERRGGGENQLTPHDLSPFGHLARPAILPAQAFRGQRACRRDESERDRA